MMGSGEDYSPAVMLPPKTPISSSIRFLGLLKIPEPDTARSGLELDERDVFWAPSSADPLDDSDSDSDPDPEEEDPSSGAGAACPNPAFGLSAVFAAEDRGGLAAHRPARPLSDQVARSVPVNVPTWHARRGFEGPLEEVEEKGEAYPDVEEEDEEEEEMVPPHVMVARSHVTAFSVFEGVGRTLKGRDLRRVRNAVFQRTGFLD